MGNCVTDVDGLNIKVHAHLCSELGKLSFRVSKIFSKVEAARPGCTSGIEALCLLNNGIVKAKSLLHQCTDSSVFYLALTGDAILSRCRRSKNLWEQSLTQIQSMVPLMLAAEISVIVADLKNATFCLDAREEEAGKMLHELLCRYGSSVDFLEDYALSSIHTISTELRLSSKKALLVEKRSIKKLLNKVDESNRSKRNILLFLLNLLKAYERTVASEPKDNSTSNAAEQATFRSYIGSNREMSCLSSSLRYDPVTISLGKTCEGMWIDKWLEEEDELSNMDPNIDKASSRILMSHVSSLGSSMNDLVLPLDFSNISMKFGNDSDPSILSSGIINSSHKLSSEFISSFRTLSWDCQCNALENAKKSIQYNSDFSWFEKPLKDLVELIIRFLKDARMFLDTEAQILGCFLLLEIVQNYRTEIREFLSEDGYDLLASLLDSNVSASVQALTILETLSSQQECCQNIAKSGALFGILTILDNKISDLILPSLNTLINLSSAIDISPYVTLSELNFKLSHLLEDDTTPSLPCITILRNLSKTANGRKSIAETESCIASLAYILEQDNQQLQEYSVSILLSLCSQEAGYCELVMEEGVIPGLVGVSAIGNRRAKSMALEVLRILRREFSATSGTDDAVMRSNKESNKTSARGLLSKILCKPSVRDAKKKIIVSKIA